jgi:hypothetical protein
LKLKIAGGAGDIFWGFCSAELSGDVDGVVAGTPPFCGAEKMMGCPGCAASFCATADKAAADNAPANSRNFKLATRKFISSLYVTAFDNSRQKRTQRKLMIKGLELMDLAHETGRFLYQPLTSGAPK